MWRPTQRDHARKALRISAGCGGSEEWAVGLVGIEQRANW